MTYNAADAQARYRKFKTLLTRSLNIAKDRRRPEDWRKVQAECAAFFAYYESSAEPMPDYWHRWERARDDARFALTQ
jgi:hypothetical protein